MNADELKEKRLEVAQNMEAIVNTAKAEERDMSDDEMDQFNALEVDYKHYNEQIRTVERMVNIAQEVSEVPQRKTEPDTPQNMQQPAKRPAWSVIVDPSANKGNFGFKNLGEFAATVHAFKGGAQDPRLIKNAPTTYGTEGVAADGGFLVPPDFRESIMEKVMGEESLLSRTDQMTTSSNTLTIPKDETTSWDSSGGLQAYWESEANQLTESKPLLEEVTLKTNKLAALVPISEELLQDAPSLDGYLRRKVPEKFDYKIQSALLTGDGAGKPLGIKNAPCLVSMTKESGQSADTVVFANIVNMWSRMYAPCRSRAVWHINQDVEPQLLQLSFEGTSSSVPAYMPANGLSGSPYASLLGRPVIPLQGCETLGDKGDIYLADWSQYLSVIKSGGIRSDVSIHLYFDYDMTAFRFIMRLTGAPWWRAAITPANSTATLGCFVTLDERA